MTGDQTANGGLAVQAAGVHKSFGALKVLDDVTLDVAAGEVVVIIGPSGSGKTTFLRCMNYLERIDGGKLYVNGHLIGYRVNADGTLAEESHAEIARQRQEIGFVFQHFNLFPHLTALQNVTASCWPGWGWRRSATPTRTSCPAVSGSGWRLRGRWR